MTTRNSAVSPATRDREFDRQLRPRRLTEFIGQEKIKGNLRIFLDAALQRGDTLDHVLLSGPPGLGKCVTADTQISTPNGPVAMGRIVPDNLRRGELRPLETVIVGVAGPERTSHVYASGIGPTVTLQTVGGARLEGTPEHPLLGEVNGALGWRLLRVLQPGDRVVTSVKGDGLHLSSGKLDGQSLTVQAAPELVWDTVASVDESVSETFDFVVPETHTFLGNGFCNHNTTLGHILAEELGASITATSGPVLDKPAALAGILTKLNHGDVLFIDEMHRLTPIVEEYLYSAMEDFNIDIVIDSGPNARNVKIPLPPFTLVGATTRKGLLTAPLRSRFGIDFRYDYYGASQLQEIVTRSAGILDVDIDAEGAFEIARRSRGTPRIANRLLRRTRDFAQVEGDGHVTIKMADRALTALDVDQEGLDEMDTRILVTLIDKFAGGPTGLSTLSVSVGEEPGTIEEVYEPYLIQEGYIQRTPRGRIATARSYRHFGRSVPGQMMDMFQPESLSRNT